MKKRLLALVVGMCLVLGSNGIVYAGDAALPDSVDASVDALEDPAGEENGYDVSQDDDVDEEEIAEDTKNEPAAENVDDDESVEVIVEAETEEDAETTEDSATAGDTEAVEDSAAAGDTEAAEDSAAAGDTEAAEDPETVESTTVIEDSEAAEDRLHPEDAKAAGSDHQDSEEKDIIETVQPETPAKNVYVKAAGHDTAQTAMGISLNSYYSDSLSKSGAKNWYKITLSNPGYVDFLFSHGFEDRDSSYWKLYLYDKNNLSNELLYRTYIGKELNEVRSNGAGLPAGTYYIKITSASYYSSASYRFKVNYTRSDYYEKEQNGTAVTATHISVNTNYKGNIMESGDKDWYSFTLTSPGYISTSFSHGYEDRNSSYWKLSLYNSDSLNSDLLYRYYIGNELNEISNSGTGLPSGTYYIKIESASYRSDKPYTFRINYTASSAWESEVNDAAESADKVSIGSNYHGNIKKSGDKDWFKFTVSAYQKISISFSHGLEERSSSYWHLRLFNSNNLNSDIMNVYYYGNETEAVTNTVYLDSGTYYINITSASYSTIIPYHFKIDRIKLSQNLSVSAKSTLAVGTSTTASVTGAKGSVTFSSSNTSIATVDKTSGKITAKAPGTVKITITSAGTSDYYAASKTVTIKVVLSKPGDCRFTKWNNAKYNSCQIAWNKVAGADGYQSVLSWTDGSHSTTKTMSSNVLSQNCSVAVNHVSQFKVRAFCNTASGKVYSPWSNVAYITPSPTDFTYKNTGTSSSPKAKVSWNIIYGCNGYNVFLTTNPNGTWYWNQSTSELATTTSADIIKYRGSKLKKNTRYYVRIVTRRKRNGVFCTVPMPANNTNIGSFVIK